MPFWERLRLEMYKRLSEVREDADVAAIRDELDDRYGELPAPVLRLLAVAMLRVKLRKAGVTEISVPGTFLRMAPVVLPDSRVVRLNRLYPKSVVKTQTSTVLVRRPSALRDEELLQWASQVVDQLLDPASVT